MSVIQENTTLFRSNCVQRVACLAEALSDQPIRGVASTGATYRELP